MTGDPEAFAQARLAGFACLVAGQLERARDFLQVATQVAPGPADGPEVIEVVAYLACVLLDLGDAAGAAPLFDRQLASIDAGTATGPRSVAPRNNLALALAELGERERARELLTANVALCTRLFGPDHPDTRTARENLATLDEF